MDKDKAACGPSHRGQAGEGEPEAARGDRPALRSDARKPTGQAGTGQSGEAKSGAAPAETVK